MDALSWEGPSAHSEARTGPRGLTKGDLVSGGCRVNRWYRVSLGEPPGLST